MRLAATDGATYIQYKDYADIRRGSLERLQTTVGSRVMRACYIIAC